MVCGKQGEAESHGKEVRPVAQVLMIPTEKLGKDKLKLGSDESGRQERTRPETIMLLMFHCWSHHL